MANMEDVEAACLELFLRTFGKGGNEEEEIVRSRAPGRVNLLGEHTDYELGYCLPCAIPLYTYCCLRRRRSSAANLECEIISTHECDDGASVTFLVGENAHAGWAKHIAGIVREYAPEFSFQASFATNIPLGAGLSSSAALEISFALALERAMYPQALLLEDEANAKARALRCVRSSNGDFVQVPCGILDQFASSLCTENHLLFIDCQTQDAEQVFYHNNMGDSRAILITNTGVKHSHATGEYKTRVLECKQASRELGVSSLRQVVAVPGEINLSTPTLTRRARHVVSENARCLRARACSASGEWTEFGQLMNQSHASLRDDFQVSCRELDFLVAHCQAHEGVLGSRMTGGGFGGCLVTLCESVEVAKELMETLERAYAKEFGLKCTSLHFTKPARGAQLL